LQDLPAWVLLTHAGSTWFMVGLAWFVFVVHYPLFAAVPEDAFVDYEARHVRQTTFVVMPVMLVELATAAWIAVQRPDWALAWVGAGLMLGVWLLTFLVQVPQHRKLERGRDVPLIRRLVAGHGLRTLVWSARGVVALAMLAGLDPTA